ncbi:MAG TPA: dihydrofolate reductase family protein [Vicinamibacterales bacterium]|nr:dihydrofolate reductase family protein [Vicinamibacterales bacterium]
MRKIIGAVFVSLDGVMQAPGAPNEDPTGGFELGGWLPQFFDEAVGKRVDALFDRDFDLLLGRRTYDIFAAFWPFAEGEEKALGKKFDRAAKYVLTNGDGPLDWENSHRLATLEDLAAVKRGSGPDLIIQGSGTLYPQLLDRCLLDELVLMTFPVILGSGKRLFGDGTPAQSMHMSEHEVTSAGNIIATYKPHGDVKPGSFSTTHPSAAELKRRDNIAKGTW